jgi:2-polyprenyl-3-methyl-5-hydroxy-6-metoxy-1,4-benzoquinol methylase
VSTKDEREARQEFSERYALAGSRLMDEIERRVIGAVWGANGFTTRAQGDELGDRLDLAPGKRLLDIGAGRGWPGLYLARQSRCEVVLTDLPTEGLRIAMQRAVSERIDLVGCVSASARELPFRSKTFDAVVHTDVLC